MARTTATNFTGALQFPYATAGTDLFKKEDVQTLALAVDSHDHSPGKGILVAGTALTWPLIAPNGAQLGAPAGNPNLFTIYQDLAVARFVSVGGSSANPSIILAVGGTATGPSPNYGLDVDFVASSSATGNIVGGLFRGATPAVSQTFNQYMGCYLLNPTRGAGSTIGSTYGLFVDPMTAGSSNNWGVYIGAPSGGSGVNVGLQNQGSTRLVGGVAVGANAAMPATNAIQIGSAADGGSISVGEFLIQRWNPNQLRLAGSAGTTQAGPLVIEAGGIDVTGNSTFRGQVSITGSNALIFSVSGYGWNGVSGQPIVQTAGSVVVNGGSLYLDSTMNNRIYWDGTYFQTNQGFVAAATGFHARDGSGNFFSGPSDQTIFGIWNPGQLRIKAATNGDLLAAGQITAEGGPVTGKGAYINSASSELIKTNVVELDPSASLARVLDPQMRPVQFEYTTTIAYGAVATAEPDPNAENPAWTNERLGFIAEEVNLVVPECVGMLADGSAHGFQEGPLISVLWAAVRALDARLKTLETPA